MQLVLNFFFVLAMIILAIVLYKLLLKRLGKKNLDPRGYCQLVSVEMNPAHGEIDFCFVTPTTKHIDFELTTLSFEVVQTLTSKNFKEGQHILKFDSTQVPNGEYYYVLKTDNQRIFKKIQIDNSNIE